jgi:hypothetical protein
MGRKVGIVTFHRAINYGAILQAYSLYTVCKRMGADPVIVDYRNPRLENRHKEFRWKDCKTPKDYIKFVLLANNYNNKFRKFRYFYEDYLELSKPYLTLEDLKKDISYYDRYICGSDQVWNGGITDLDPAYFLTFANTEQRNSYAASFGFGVLADDKIDKYKQLLSGFNHMSVRERDGADIIKRLLGNEVSVVLDPTLLLNKEDWSTLTVQSKHKDYILVYGFGKGNHLLDFAISLAKETGLKIVRIGNSYMPSRKFSYERSACPREFIGLFSAASYVVTNSFHGTAFAINFNKEFFTEMLPEAQSVNSRLENILDLFDLGSRQIRSSDASRIQAIDYDHVNEKLKNERERSLEFLESIIFG